MQYTVTARGTGTSEEGEVQLAFGNGLEMPKWERVPAGICEEPHAVPYGYVGYALERRARLIIEGEEHALRPGNSYLVPANTRSRFEIDEAFTAVEVTTAER